MAVKRKRAKKRAPSATESGRMLILLEEIKAQNRATIAAIQRISVEIRRDLVAQLRELRMPIENLELATRSQTQTIREIIAFVRKNREGIRGVS